MVTGESLLETPTYVIAIVLVGFQIAALFFSTLIATIKRFLSRRKRMGLVAAVTHMEEELMLVGFISLCLIALQQPLTSICVDASPNRATWSMLHHTYTSSCDCCLSTTKNVMPCIMSFAKCGNETNPYANCVCGGNVNGQCAAQLNGMILPALAGAVDSHGVVAGAVDSHGVVAGAVSGAHGALAPGVDAAHAAVAGAVDAAHGAAAPAADTAHAAATGAVDAAHAPAADAAHATDTAAIDAAHATVVAAADTAHAAGHRRRNLLSAASTAAAVCEGAVTVAAGSCPAGQMPAVTYLALEQVHLLIFTVVLVHVFCSFLLYFGALGRIRWQWGRWDALDNEESGQARAEVQRYHDSLGAQPASPETNGEEGLSPAAADLEGQAVAAAPAKSRVALAWVKEATICLFLGISPRVVTSNQYIRMRTSFFLTHKLGPNFAFLDFVQSSLEEDLSHVVGLSLEFWFIIVLFVLMAGPWGFLTMIFMAVTGALLVLTNGKLAAIIRAVTGGNVSRLNSGVFWFNRPPILLIPIKFTLFLCSFLYAWFVFSVWQFGAHSCPFSNSFYPYYVLPWWTILIFNTVIFLHLAVTTLPTYSLAVQMGSDWKAHMLPHKLTKRLLAVAEATKRKVKAKQALESGHGAPSHASTHGHVRTDKIVDGLVNHIVGAHGHE